MMSVSYDGNHMFLVWLMSTSTNLPASLNLNFPSGKQCITCHQHKHRMGVWRIVEFVEISYALLLVRHKIIVYKSNWAHKPYIAL